MNAGTGQLCGLRPVAIGYRPRRHRVSRPGNVGALEFQWTARRSMRPMSGPARTPLDCDGRAVSAVFRGSRRIAGGSGYGGARAMKADRSWVRVRGSSIPGPGAAARGADTGFRGSETMPGPTWEAAGAAAGKKAGRIRSGWRWNWLGGCWSARGPCTLRP